ncbi:MAG: glycosyltransferase family 4 protein [Candidatus Omnitrophica bacterium]|nr:glycosyltransferase family 4 protein [Candidatus Omnitrophota bacterium]
MKILHLTTHLNTGGITTYIETLGRFLNAEGHTVAVLSSGGEMVPHYEACGIPCYIMDIKTKSELSPKLYRAIPKVVKLVKAERFDLIHAHTRVTQVLANWVKLFTGVPCVSTCHGFYKRRLGRRIFPAWGDYVIAISGAVGENLKHYFKVNENKIRVVHNAVDMNRIISEYAVANPADVRKSLKLPPETFVIGSVARLVRDKGHEYLVKAVPEILKEFPNIRVLIIGDGPYRRQLEKLTKCLNLEHYVLFLGNRRDVIRLLSVVDIFILPAVWREGFGLSMIEAMTAKKPIVVTNICALNTIITPGVNGLMVPPKDSKSIAGAICDLLRDTELREKISDGGHQFVRDNFSLPTLQKGILSVYREVEAIYKKAASVRV